MNTHDIELPPLPEGLIAQTMLATEVRSLLRRYGERCWDAAIEADRKRRGEPVAWHPIDTAPHNETVLLGWRDWDGEWMAEVCVASWGWRTNSVSNISKHGRATHWMPLPPQPAEPSGAQKLHNDACGAQNENQAPQGN